MLNIISILFALSAVAPVIGMTNSDSSVSEDTATGQGESAGVHIEVRHPFVVTQNSVHHIGLDEVGAPVEYFDFFGPVVITAQPTSFVQVGEMAVTNDDCSLQINVDTEGNLVTHYEFSNPLIVNASPMVN